MKKIIVTTLILFSIVINAQTTAGKHLLKLVDISTKHADFGISFYAKDQVVFAAPSEKVRIVKRVWRENGQQYLDLFVGDIDSTGTIVNKRPLKGQVNKRLHEASAVFTKDGKRVYFSANNYNVDDKSVRGKEGYDNIQLYSAEIDEEGAWGNIKKLPFNSDDFQTGLPTLNKDESKMYFVSDRPGSIGKTDLYVVDIENDTIFSEPKNLGPKINTVEKEMFPFMSDDDILYFSSNGHPGHGDLDVFAAKIYDNTVSDVLNLGKPVNSIKDDFAYILKNEEHTGYVSSNRGEGKGDDDIYQFVEEEELYIECLQTISGLVRDKDTQELLPGTQVKLLNKDGNEIEVVTSDAETATYSFNAPCNTEYKIVASSEGYLEKEIDVKTVNDIDQPALETNIDMTPEFRLVGDELLVNIDVIYFDFNKSKIRPDAAKELDKVVDVMKKYPELDIYATSHTDERGSAGYNMRLSKRRAKSTVKYIVSKGIDAERISSDGKGEAEPAVDCKTKKCTEEDHQLNRRTNFKIQEKIRVKVGDIKGAENAPSEVIEGVEETDQD